MSRRCNSPRHPAWHPPSTEVPCRRPAALCRRIMRGVNLRHSSRLRTRPLALQNRNRFVTNTLLVSSLNTPKLARNVIWRTNHETTSPHAVRQRTQAGQLGQPGSPSRRPAPPFPIQHGIGATLPGRGTLSHAHAPTPGQGLPETIYRARPAGECLRACPQTSAREKVKLRIASAAPLAEV